MRFFKGIVFMNAIYIKNYLSLTDEEKKQFFIFLKNNNVFTLVRQRVILTENALLLDFTTNSDIKKTKTLIDNYLSTFDGISTHIIKNIIQQNDHLVLEFDNRKLRV